MYYLSELVGNGEEERAVRVSETLAEFRHAAQGQGVGSLVWKPVGRCETGRSAFTTASLAAPAQVT